METVQSFEAQVKKRLLEHEFHPICIEATNRKKRRAKSWEKWKMTHYEKYLGKQKQWREENKSHISEYHKEWIKKNPWYRKEARLRHKLKMKLNALWEILTYEPGYNNS